MRHFHWTKAHAVFIPQIDAEHRNIFRLADEFQQAALAARSLERVRAALKSLAASLEDHFAHEERLMFSMDYPAYEWHKRQHDGARRRVREFAALIENGDAKASSALLHYLSSWMRDHTGLTDRMMAAHVRNYERRSALMAS